MFFPPFHEAVKNNQLGGRPDLDISILTVAGQYRTYTGFAFTFSHPGVKQPDDYLYKNCLKYPVLFLAEFRFAPEFHCIKILIFTRSKVKSWIRFWYSYFISHVVKT